MRPLNGPLALVAVHALDADQGELVLAHILHHGMNLLPS